MVFHDFWVVLRAECSVKHGVLRLAKARMQGHTKTRGKRTSQLLDVEDDGGKTGRTGTRGTTWNTQRENK